MKRMLCIVSAMNTGGAETFLMKIYRELDKTRYQMDFCVSVTEKGAYDDEIREMGGKLFYVTPKSQKPWKYFFDMVNVVRDNNYQYVMRISHHSLAALDLLAAKFGGAKRLVFRSSNAGGDSRMIPCALNILFKPFVWMLPDKKIAPSKLAGEYVFGKSAVKRGKVLLLKNAIPIEKYAFDEAARERIRTEFDWNDCLLVGHIGRFCIQKNHQFLLNIFSEIRRLNSNARLVMIGCGELMDTVRKQSRELGIEDCVDFLGVRNNVSEFLSAMDIMVFPSLFEGMPNTVIEAQASGLPCVISDTITREADITGLVQYLSLESGAGIWADTALRMSEGGERDVSEKIRNAGYSIGDIVDQFADEVFEK